MSESDYSQIWTRIQSNDHAALKELFQQQFVPVCQGIFRLVRDRELTRDLAQNVFIRLWEKRNQLTITSSLPAYLRRMGHNEALAHLRSKKNWTVDEEEMPEQTDEHSPEDSLLEGELGQRIDSAIEKLPPRCQAVFRLSRFEDLSYREIAERLSVSVKTVENQMGKALRMLRTEMAPYLKDP